MWPFKKKTNASKVRAFQAAVIGRLTNEWITSSTTMDSELRSSLPKMRARCRDLARNNDYVKNFLRVVQNNVVGQGIPFQAQVKQQRGKNGKKKLDQATNDAIESAWWNWTRAESCDVAGQLCFSEIERLAMREVAEVGEVFIRMVRQPMGRLKTPLALEVIESESLDEGYNLKPTAGGNEIRMGVEVNSWGRPVAYHFLSKPPGDIERSEFQTLSERRMRVPAEEIIHLFVAERRPQNRGVPWLATAVMRLHHMQGFEEAEVIAARISACTMAFIETPEGQASIVDGQDAGKNVSDMEPGLTQVLGPGEVMKPFLPSRPGGQFEPFVRLMLRGVGAGGGASYESLSRDYSQTNYSSARQGLIEDRDNWRALQWWLIAKLHQRVYEEWLDLAMLSGDLVLKGYETMPDAYKQVKWMPRGWSWVDPAKEVSAYKDAVRSGFMTQSDVIAQSGGDIDEFMDQRERETKLAIEKGLVFDSDPAQVNASGADQAAAESPPEDVPADA